MWLISLIREEAGRKTTQIKNLSNFQNKSKQIYNIIKW